MTEPETIGRQDAIALIAAFTATGQQPELKAPGEMKSRPIPIWVGGMKG